MQTIETISAGLTRFWSSHGCASLAACDLPVPLPIMHPELFLRLFDPQPWRAQVLQPVRRPTDGRYGRHPFRMARHHQLQVVLKPGEADARDLFLASLRRLGFQPRRHDLRLVDWHWRSHSLDTEGLGWHVLLDGMAVGRVTFLHTAAGRRLEPPILEAGYGLERLVVALAGPGKQAPATEESAASDADNESWLRRRWEEDLTRYAFSVADTEREEQLLDEACAEVTRRLDSGLALPAYELAVRSLERVDLLETRGRLLGRERDTWLERLRLLVVAAVEEVAAAQSEGLAESESEAEASVPSSERGEDPSEHAEAAAQASAAQSEPAGAEAASSSSDGSSSADSGETADASAAGEEPESPGGDDGRS